MLWRLIPYARHRAAWNMAVDEAIFESLIRGDSPPTLRFYGWESPSVTVGRLQPVSSVPEGWGRRVWVRRPTGGRAVLHDGDLTFSLVVPSSILGSRVGSSYERTAAAIRDALRSEGIPADMCRNTTPAESVRGIGNCFDLTLGSELEIAGAKVLGSAQVRRSGVVLQQNSLVLPQEFRRVISSLVESITRSLESTFNVSINIGELSPDELKIARGCADNKYTIVPSDRVAV